MARIYHTPASRWELQALSIARWYWRYGWKSQIMVCWKHGVFPTIFGRHSLTLMDIKKTKGAAWLNALNLDQQLKELKNEPTNAPWG